MLSTRPSGKLRLTSVSSLAVVVPAMPDADWYRTVTLEPGMTLVVPEGVVHGAHVAFAGRDAPADSFTAALRTRAIIVTEVPVSKANQASQAKPSEEQST